MLTTPVPTPVTTPDGLTVATVGVPLVQEPPAGVPVSEMRLPVQTLVGPVTAVAALTEKGEVTNEAPTV